jgi:hypothetical protein
VEYARDKKVRRARGIHKHIELASTYPLKFDENCRHKQSEPPRVHHGEAGQDHFDAEAARPVGETAGASAPRQPS